MELKVNQNNVGERLDKYLAGQISEQSRNQLQKLIKNGSVLINEQPVSPHYIVREGDLVKIVNVEKNNNTEKRSEEKKEEKPVPNFEVIAENGDYIVINKPAGLIVHQAENNTGVFLTDLLMAKYPEISKVGEDPSRPGIVHRLDKEVSGLMVIARNNDFFESLKYQFKTRVVQKSYTALAYGRILNDDDLIRFPIDRSTDGYKMSALPLTVKGIETNKGRRAITEFNIVKKFVNYTLIKVRIKTGRTHQIRVHFCAYGHPLVGDDLYGTHKTKLQNKKLNLGRIFLVADELAFIDRAGQKKHFTLDLPIELKEFLNKVK